MEQSPRAFQWLLKALANTRYSASPMVWLCYSVVTIFLGLYMTKLALPLWTKGVMGAFICFHALIEVILAIYMHLDKKSKKEKDVSSMTGKRASCFDTVKKPYYSSF